jgi:predicted permease
VTPDFFAAMGTRIVRGRAFDDGDAATAEPVAILNETLARAAWPGEEPIGQCIRIGDPAAACTRVIGVSENSRRQNWIDDEFFHVHLPLTQAPSWMSTRIVIARVDEGDETRMLGTLRQVMQGAAPSLPYADVRTFLSLYDSELRSWRLGATMFGAFASLALVLAAVGLYGVVSFGVAQRAHEIGVRMALGARVVQIVRLVLRQGIVVAVLGVLVGTGLAVALGRLVEGLLFRVSPRDPATFAAVAMSLLVVAVAACVVPAWRAARIDPTTALRAE